MLELMKAGTDKNTETVNAMLDDLVADIGNPPSITNLAKKYNFSKNYVIRIFKNEVGMTPYQYLKKIRLQKAKQLLRLKETTVEQISLECGYRDYSRFYRDFYEANRSILYDFNVANQVMGEDPLQMIVNLLNHIHFPNLVQVQAIMQFKKDMLIVLRSKEDISIQRCYDFNYKEYRENRPLEELSVASSELLLKKENGQSFVRLLQIITHPST